MVFVIVDGISADMLEKADTPFLDSISKSGGYSKAYVGGTVGGITETPTISAVGYNSLLTGTWAHKHNVFGNDIQNPNYNYPTIFKVVKEQVKHKKTAIFSTWEDNRTKLLGEHLEQTGFLKLDYAYDGFELDTIRFPHDDEKRYIRDIDKMVAEEASRYVLKEGPDLSWVYLEYTDDVGHKYGDGLQMNEAITFEDQLIGKIWQSITARERSFNEEWLLLITTDHGRMAQDGKGHGGQSERERSTWLVTNARDTNTYFKTQTVAIVDLMPTMLRFMNLEVDERMAYEIDGVPIIGKTDLFDLKAERKGNRVVVSWKAITESEEQVEILLSTTNNFKAGGQDHYRRVGEAHVKDETFSIPLEKGYDFLKIVVKTGSNSTNTWLLPE